MTQDSTLKAIWDAATSWNTTQEDAKASLDVLTLSHVAQAVTLLSQNVMPLTWDGLPGTTLEASQDVFTLGNKRFDIIRPLLLPQINTAA